MATFVLAGPRISELCALDWAGVDLDHGWLRIGGTKTHAATRDTPIGPLLAEVLREHREVHGGIGLVFPSATGRRQGKDNIRNRVHNRVMQEAGIDDITPHGLRRTYISLMIAAGFDPRSVMQWAGHTDAKFTLSVYAQAIRSRSAAQALVGTPAMLED
jgi:integrase